MVQSFSEILHQQWLTDITVRYDFFQPACETLHFFGLALLVGIVGLFDLRLLGLGKGIPIASLHRLIPWGLAGFVLCLLTGLVFLMGDPFRDPAWYLNNISFRLKMLLIGLAGVNALLFYVTGLAKTVAQLAPSDEAPRSARAIALSSILLWIGVMYFGRMLPWQDALYMLFEDPSDWG